MKAAVRTSYAVEFRTPRPAQSPEPPGRVPRVARMLALAHQIDAMIRAGKIADLAEAARRLGLTRARVTQIVNLTLLAPAIQEPILDLPPVTSGRDRITERTLRPIVTEPAWERQMVRWRSICSHGGF